MINQNFQYGDLVVVTSERQKQYSGIASKRWMSYYDHDVDYDEAVNKHYLNMKNFGLNVSIEQVKSIITRDQKYFINTQGDIISYQNHEIADEFDKMFLLENMPIQEVSFKKDDYIEKHPVEIDDDHIYRIHELRWKKARYVINDNDKNDLKYTWQSFNYDTGEWEWQDVLTYVPTNTKMVVWKDKREDIALPYHEILEDDVKYSTLINQNKND